jgi:hypothetical protein
MSRRLGRGNAGWAIVSTGGVAAAGLPVVDVRLTRLRPTLNAAALR